jgi:MoaA/NifB/PqqE/SkfB family radical SAM enzyme
VGQTLNTLASGVDLARAVASPQPNYMVMFVTAVCNARCPMCFYWEEIESANAKLELRLEEYEKITQHLDHLYYLSIGGGEPFTRKDLPQIVETFYNNSSTRIVNVVTNGWFAERVRQYIEYLQENCPRIQLRIQVSIDNLYEKHDKNRVLDGLFEKLLETCRVIGEMKQAGAPVMLSIGTVLTPDNRDDLEEIRAFLDEHIPYDDLSLIYPRGNAKDPYFKQVSLEEYREARKKYDANRTQFGSFARIYRAIDREAKAGIENYLEKGPSGYPWICSAGKKMVTLTERGLVSPCEMLYQISPEIDSDLGNVRKNDYNIPAMLASEKAQKLRSWIVDTPCTCSYECAALTNVVFDAKNWHRLVPHLFNE